MSLASLVVLLQTALSLLVLVNANPSLPQSTRDYASQVAQQAITQATSVLAAQTIGSTGRAVTAPVPTPIPTPPPVTAVASCNFNGFTIPSGQFVIAYQAAAVASGSTCVSETRVCTNGVLSGSNAYTACVVNAPAFCSWNGQTVTNGQSITAYQAATVSYGQTCQPQTRTCVNGALSGSYGFASCVAGTASSCAFNGQTIASGQSVTAYQSASVANGSICVSETRTCANGTLSGNYRYGSCTIAAAPGPVAPAVSATLLGQTGEDIVGQQTTGSDGVKDEHVRLTGVASPIQSVSISAPGGLWTYPQTTGVWIVAVRPTSDQTVVDLYFDHYKDYTVYTINGQLANGTSFSVTTTGAVTSSIQLFSSSVQDLYSHFWTGDHTTGYITPTWTGTVGEVLPNPRGLMWPMSTFFGTLYTSYLLQPDDAHAQPLRAQWNFVASHFSDNDLTACGQSSAENFYSDDAGWNAGALLDMYEVTRDHRALSDAEGAVNCSYSRWGDSQFGGGVWYDDHRNAKSLYETSLALDALHIYRLTQDKSFLALAKRSYDWMQSTLLRSDNIYWAEYGWPSANHSASPTPIGVDRPNDIHMAGSVSFLAGTMAMDVLHAEFYEITGDETYRQRAIDVANGILSKFVDQSGGFLDERDGWTNGAFARDWMIHVYPLLPPDVQSKASVVFNNTATNIRTLDRTDDGYYGPSWAGPATYAWSSNGTNAHQIMTSTQAVDFIAPPAIIEAHLQPPPMPHSSFPAPSSTIHAVYLGTGQDLVNTKTQSPDGIPDVHLRLSSVMSGISAMRIIPIGAIGALNYPSNGVDWMAFPRSVQGDPTNVDVYFNLDQGHPVSVYVVNLTLTDGTTQTIVAQ